MVDISINIPFWESVRERTENLQFVSHHLNEFKKFLEKNNVSCSVNVFDFSEKKVIPESIHIPYPKGSFRKSEKINQILKYNCENICPKIYCQFDSDVFFKVESYQNILNTIKQFDNNKFYVSNVNDIDMSQRHLINYDVKVLKQGIRLNERTVYGLGGTFLVSFETLYNIGGFDERFQYWGGEDDDVANRLVRLGLQRESYSAKLYHLPHPHATMTLNETPKEYHKSIESVYKDYSIYRKTSLNI
jgi:hypothetical protein